MDQVRFNYPNKYGYWSIIRVDTSKQLDVFLPILFHVRNESDESHRNIRIPQNGNER